MRHFTVDAILAMGATEEEARTAVIFLNTVSPGLKWKKKDRIDTEWGEKTPLGYFRTVKRLVNGG